MSKGKHKRIKEEIRIEDEIETVYPKPQIRILGWIINERMRLDSNLNLTIGVIHSILNNLKPIEKYITKEKKVKIATSHIISKISYSLPLYLGETQKTKHRIHLTIMMLARWTRSSYCFKESVSSICESIKWETPGQLLLKRSAVYIHKITSSTQPKQIF